MTLLQSLHQNAYDQRCSIATLHAKSFGNSTNLCTTSDWQCATTPGRSIARNHCNAVNLKCNTAVLDWNKSVRANPRPTRVIQTVQLLSGDKHKGEATFFCKLLILQEHLEHTCCHAFEWILADYHRCKWSPGLWWSTTAHHLTQDWPFGLLWGNQYLHSLM